MRIALDRERSGVYQYFGVEPYRVAGGWRVFDDLPAALEGFFRRHLKEDEVYEK